jgi:hypothetical protein
VDNGIVLIPEQVPHAPESITETACARAERKFPVGHSIHLQMDRLLLKALCNTKYMPKKIDPLGSFVNVAELAVENNSNAFR